MFLAMLLASAGLSAQNTFPNDKPRLVVGIVVDQMRYDYLVRYWNNFGENGFKKLIAEGFNCTNTHYNYVPTYTGPGHASIYTGTTPAVHGIISNEWFSRKSGVSLYVTSDNSVSVVGDNDSLPGMSPANLISTTITDELKLASNMRSKVIGISLKDRGAILPAGHAADAAYWFDAVSSDWISSSYYVDELPGWVVQFNNLGMAQSLTRNPWTTMLPMEKYGSSTGDDTPYEVPFSGESRPVFPHETTRQTSSIYGPVQTTPAGNVLTKEFALAAIKGENLGADTWTDFLAVSFSSPDFIGHQFGTNSIETEDNYIRLDADLADFIKKTESMIGKSNVLFFLTSDHGAIPNVMFLRDRKIPGGLFNIASLKDSIVQFIRNKYGSQNWILSVMNDQVYLDRNAINDAKFDYESVCEELALYISGIDHIAVCLTSGDLRKNEYTWGIRNLVQKGYYGPRSGDIVFHLEPGLSEYSSRGTTHGSGYAYDTQVPLIFYGAGIRHGETARHIDITDIAPTLSQLLDLQMPSGNTGKVIDEVLR